jgi:threonine dehydratase
VEVALTLETRGPEHCAEVVDALRAAGHAVVDVAGGRER